MTKYSTKFKIQAVKAYLDGEGGFAYLANKFGLPSTYDLRKWVDLVKEQGFQALQVSHGKRYYSLDFKLEVINYYRNHELGTSKVAAKFNIERSLVYSWYRKYKNEEIVGLRTKAKGRPRKTMNNKKVKRSSLTPTEKEQYQQTIADLKAQLAHERMKCRGRL